MPHHDRELPPVCRVCGEDDPGCVSPVSLTCYACETAEMFEMERLEREYREAHPRPCDPR